MKRKTFAIAAMLFLVALTAEASAQMGGGMMGPRSGMGQGGMGGGQGYGPGYGPYGSSPSPEGRQSSPNLTPEEQKARAKAFVDDYLRRNLPEYELQRKDSKKSK